MADSKPTTNTSAGAKSAAAGPRKQQKFFEVIRSDVNLNFVGHIKFWLAMSTSVVILSILMLPINHFLIKSRGHALNFGIDFRGGSEITIDFTRAVNTDDIRNALTGAGIPDVEVIASPDATHPNKYLIRSTLSTPFTDEDINNFQGAVQKATAPLATLTAYDHPESSSKVYLTFDKDVTDVGGLTTDLKAAGLPVAWAQPQPGHRFEVELSGIDKTVTDAISAKLGSDLIAPERVEADVIGAKAGAELRDDGIKSLLYAILLIMVYIAFRFDFRYGPGTVIALLHDAIITMGAFALTYKEFSLTTIAAILTIIGYSMNDTVVVFDRIRENAGRMRDRAFDKVVNISVNETLSRTILTSLTVFFVTLAMNILGTGVIRDFAFAMNVGVIVGTYSSVFIAAPILIWLNNLATKRQTARGKQAPVTASP
jgi:preprotein translocase subunit SecF